MKKLSFIAVFLILGFFLFQKGAVAAVQKGIEVQPAFVDVDLTPKAAEEEIEITYINHTDRPVTLELFPINFRHTSPQGGVSFLGDNSGEYSYSLSSFLSFETTRLDLEPRGKKVLRVVASNRQDLTPGGHYAAVIARLVQEDVEATFDTAVAPAVSTLIFLRKVGGEQFNLSLRTLSWPATIAFSYPPTITLLFQNEGNVHLTPIGSMEVKDIFGRLLYKGIVNEAYVKVLPESQRYVPLYLKRLAMSWPVSLNTMTLTGTDSLKKVTFKRTEVFIYIHPVIPGILVGLVILLFLLQRRKKRVKDGEKNSKEAGVPVATSTSTTKVKKQRRKAVDNPVTRK